MHVRALGLSCEPCGNHSHHLSTPATRQLAHPEMCTFGLLGCRVKPQRAHQTGPPGLAHPWRFKHHQNSTQGPQERERRKKLVAGGEKKERNFGRSCGGLSSGRLSSGGLSGGGELSGGGLSGGGLSGGGGVQRKGPSEIGCRVRGFGFSSGFWRQLSEVELAEVEHPPQHHHRCKPINKNVEEQRREHSANA